MSDSSVGFSAKREEDTAYFPQIDGLRGLAILGVLANHFMSFPGSAYCGWLGVCLFFVLSGFLITGILLRERQRAEISSGYVGALGVFYLRRGLRIFPAYFLTVLVLWLTNHPGIGNRVWWMVTYTYNYYAIFDWSGDYGHFWSLCVEEQFYLIWPALLFFCPRTWLVSAMTGTLLTGLAWRVGCVVYSTSTVPMIVALPSCLDCLSTGALLAYFLAAERRQTSGKRFLAFCKYAGGALMLLWLGALNLRQPVLLGHVPIEAVYGNTAMALFFAFAVGRATEPLFGFWALLRNKWLIHLGTISYGIYIYHNFMPAIWRTVQPRIPLFAVPDLYAHLALTIVVASASWFLFEKPINRLKTRFNYAPRTTSERQHGPLQRAA
jgi:peptidoglycan/LPS O-acetylase OafA/YrhL